MKPGSVDFLLLTGLAAIFGASFMFTRIAVVDIPPLTVVAWRLFLAFCAIYPLLLLSGQQLPRNGRLWLLIAASAFFGNALPFSLISWGQVEVSAGMTAIFMAVMPLITLLLAHVVTDDEKLNRYKLIGVLLGLAGVVVLMGWERLVQMDGSLVRQMAIAAGATSYAVNALITRQLTQTARLPMMAALMLAASVMMMPFSLVIDGPWTLTPSVVSVLSIVALALGPTAFATLLILVIIDRQGASFLSQINFMVPLFGVLFGALFLAERLPPTAFMALVLILGGIALSKWGARHGLSTPR